MLRAARPAAALVIVLVAGVGLTACEDSSPVRAAPSTSQAGPLPPLAQVCQDLTAYSKEILRRSPQYGEFDLEGLEPFLNDAARTFHRDAERLRQAGDRWRAAVEALARFVERAAHVAARSSARHALQLAGFAVVGAADSGLTDACPS